MKKPSFQFYPGDWRKDQNLSRASLQAKGALIEIMCLAFECEKRGYLKTGKDPWTIEEIAHAIGGDKMKNIEAIEELLHKKILKKDKKNAIFSARMVRDEKLSKIRRKAGLMGGNKILLNQNGSKAPPPSASASSSSSTSVKKELSRDAVFLLLREATNKNTITDRQLHDEVGDFMIKYSEQEIKNLKALCNTWAGNIKPKKKGVVI